MGGNNKSNFLVVKNIMPDKNAMENYKVRFVSSLFLLPKGSEFKPRTIYVGQQIVCVD